MDSRLSAIVAQYRAEVGEATALLATRFETTDVSRQRELARATPTPGVNFHGTGCCVRLSRDRVIDFEFGPGGRTDGFDLWRLTQFLRARRKLRTEISEGELALVFDTAVSEGSLVPLTVEPGALDPVGFVNDRLFVPREEIS